jgi:N-acetylglucosamine kinase-like BadF-type ATPase
MSVEQSGELVAALASEVGAPADLAVVLLAGLDFPDEEEAYELEAARRGWAARTITGNDTFAVLRAGTDRGWGVAVTCGRGINCVGVAPDGSRLRFPSLGLISGDWGGGGDVGLWALWSAARSEDGRGPKTELERLVPGYFGLETPAELARAVHLGHVPQRRLHELTPVVFAAAANDAVAAEIVDRQADEVVAMARAALTRLDLLHEPVDVVLGGGLLQSGNGRLLDRITAGLHAAAPALSVKPAESPPVVGSALLGLDELGAPPEAKERVRTELGEAVAGFDARAELPLA